MISMANQVIVIFIGLVMVFELIQGSPLSGLKNMDQKDRRAKTEQYLKTFGYLGKKNPNPEISNQEHITDAMYESAIMEFQIMAGMEKITGILDDETMRMMEMPRCGVEDKMTRGDGSKRRKKRYVTEGSKWDTNDLRYKIINFTPDISESDAAYEIERAFKVWSDVTPLTFTRVYRNDQAHINIQFRSREHGDGYPFDGKSGTLAHAFFPKYGGASHFDEDETWTLNTYRGTNLFQVAAHEFGHALGLLHSQDKNALMYAFYRGYQPSFTLYQDDEEGIQRIYGRATPVTRPPKTTTTTTTTTPRTTTIRRPAATRPTTKSTTTTTTMAPNGGPPLCRNTKIDSITLIGDSTYVFQGTMVYKLKLNVNGIEHGYPRLISDEFPGIPNHLDAVVHWPSKYINGALKRARTYFFKGSQYYRFQNGRVNYTYPITRGFRDLPSSIDAAFVWSGNGYTYFIKGNQYYKYYRGYGVGGGYPKPLSYWKGLPSSIDGAIQWRNYRTYFFSGNTYYRFNDYSFKTDYNYPRPTQNIWFGCYQAGNIETGVETMDQDVFVKVNMDGTITNPKGTDTSAAHRGYAKSPVVLILLTVVFFINRIVLL